MKEGEKKEGGSFFLTSPFGEKGKKRRGGRKRKG